MPSILPGFEYDIFISYRHKDNKGDQWVTEFVKALKTELDSTFKEDISIYFDVNPHDGLLETHNVDKSLEGKLKCLIFIPIISQTYCDPKSFAWQHEFCAFNKLAKEDQFGRDIKLSNGNVASRILPIKIHDLDSEDKTTIENEIGGLLRAVEFVFNSPGVNRPLTPADHSDKNQNKIAYRDQINKSANAIKEIVGILKNFETSKSKNESLYRDLPTRLPYEQVKSNGWSKHKVALGGVIILLLFVAGYLVYPKLRSPSKSAASVEKSIAVLPFENISKDPEQEYFSDGITEDIITQLSKIGVLSVSPRSMVLKYKNSSEMPGEIAIALRVNFILEGTVRLSGNRVLITANLIDIASEKQLWAEKYDRELKDIFNVQADVAQQIAMSMRASLTAEEKDHVEAVPTENAEAYQVYLKGRYHYSHNTFEEENQALQLFTQALKIDQNYALAWVGLSQCYSQFGYYHYPPLLPLEAFSKAKGAVEKALKINPNLSEAHAALAYLLRTYEWDWVGAEKAYLKAIELNPKNAFAYDQFSLLYAALGKFDQAILYSKRASHLDPLNVNTLLDEARVLTFAGQNNLAFATTRNALQLDKHFAMFHGMLGALYEQAGVPDSALSEFKVCGSRTGLDYEGAFEKFTPVEAPNLIEYWQKTLASATRDFKNQQVSNFIMAILYARTGNDEKAIEALEMAHKAREGPMVYVNVEPVFRHLRKNARFKKIVVSMRLQN